MVCQGRDFLSRQTFDLVEVDVSIMEDTDLEVFERSIEFIQVLFNKII